jgi:hypothetical protein
MRGLVPERKGSTGLDHPPQVHHADLVGDVPDDREVVRDEQQSEPEVARQAAEQVRELRLRRGIEGGERLVEHDHGRVGRERLAQSRRAGAGRLRTRAESGRPRSATGRPRSSTSRTRGSRASRSAEAVGDLAADRAARIQRGVGILENHLQPHERGRAPAASAV